VLFFLFNTILDFDACHSVKKVTLQTENPASATENLLDYCQNILKSAHKTQEVLHLQ